MNKISVHDNYKAVHMTSVNFGFISNVTILVIQITDIYKTMMNPVIAQNLAAQIFLSTLYQVTKISWLVVSVLIVKLLFKPLPNLELLNKQFSNSTAENSNDLENIFSSKYCDIDEMHNIEIPHKNKSLSLFHISTCSPDKNFDDFHRA